MSRSYRKRKLRAPQGLLQNLASNIREQLHEWLRQEDPPVPYKEIQSRLEKLTGYRVSVTSLCEYFDRNQGTIFPPAPLQATPKTITIRIVVPAGCSVDVSTTEGGEHDT
jgi:hypothetical protein